jgi:hypothetical protein
MTVRFAGRASLLLLLSAPGLALADATIGYDVSGGGCSANIGKVQVKGKRLRWDLYDGSASALFDGFESTLVSLDHRQKQRFEMDVDFDTLDYKEDVMASADRKLSPSMRALHGDADDKDCMALLKEIPRYETPSGGAPIQVGNCEISADGKSAKATQSAPGSAMAGGAMTSMPDARHMNEMLRQAQKDMAANGSEMSPEQQQQMQAMMASMMANGGATAGQLPGADSGRRGGAVPEPTDADFEHPAIAVIPTGGVMGSMGAMVGRPASTVRVEAIGAMENIAGIPCTPYRRYLGDELLAQECWARNSDLPLDPKDVATLTAAHTAVGMLQNLGDQNRAAARRTAAKETLVSRRCAGELGSVTIEIGKGPVDDKVFEVPGGYAPVSME